MTEINGADTAWVLVSCALVLLMTPGLALFYGGMVNSRNVLSTFMHSFIALGVMTIQWVVIGYSISFAPDIGNGLTGGLDHVFLMGVAHDEVRSGLTIPVNAIYIAPVVVLVIVLAVWMLGVRWGRNDAERALTDAGISLPVAPNDPLADPAQSSTSPPQSTVPAPVTNPAPQPQPNSARTDTGPGGVPLDPKGKLISSRGPIGADPRTKGLNYLHIASLPLEDAQNALAYLAQNKIEAIAVPMGVDSGAQTAKNQSWYQVVVLVGITGDEYRNRDKPGRAKQAEALIRKLGTQWKNDKRGPSDFSKILWVRCQ